MWISRFRGHNNEGYNKHSYHSNSTFYDFEMQRTALVLLAILYPYGNFENKACSGITALVITVYGKPTKLSSVT